VGPGARIAGKGRGNPVRALIGLTSLMLVAACSPGVPETGYRHSTGLGFDFPPGWSVPTSQEWRDLNLGDDHSLVTIMDASREAGFSVVPVNLDANESFVLNLLDDEPAARGVMFVESIDAAGPGRYEEYRLLGKRPVLFSGAPLSEITFQGRTPGKDLKWRRLLALTTQSDAILMLIFSAPADGVEDFRDDFEFIESSWRWGI
jgi:hypothetical protein